MLFLYSSRGSGIWWNQTKLKSGISAALRGAISPASEGQAISEPTQPNCGTDGTPVATFFLVKMGYMNGKSQDGRSCWHELDSLT